MLSQYSKRHIASKNSKRRQNHTKSSSNDKSRQRLEWKQSKHQRQKNRKLSLIGKYMFTQSEVKTSMIDEFCSAAGNIRYWCDYSLDLFNKYYDFEWCDKCSKSALDEGEFKLCKTCYSRLNKIDMCNDCTKFATHYITKENKCVYKYCDSCILDYCEKCCCFHYDNLYYPIIDGVQSRLCYKCAVEKKCCPECVELVTDKNKGDLNNGWCSECCKGKYVVKCISMCGKSKEIIVRGTNYIKELYCKLKNAGFYNDTQHIWGVRLITLEDDDDDGDPISNYTKIHDVTKYSRDMITLMVILLDRDIKFCVYCRTLENVFRIYIDDKHDHMFNYSLICCAKCNPTNQCKYAHYNYKKKRWESDCEELHPYSYPSSYCEYCRF